LSLRISSAFVSDNPSNPDFSPSYARAHRLLARDLQTQGTDQKYALIGKLANLKFLDRACSN